MKKHITILVLMFAVVSTVFAHNGMAHVMGTVAAITQTNITVKATDGKTQVVQLTPGTKYLRGTHAMSLKEIKAGDRVVIHATKKGGQLVAAEVKAGDAKSASAGMSMKMGEGKP